MAQGGDKDEADGYLFGIDHNTMLKLTLDEETDETDGTEAEDAEAGERRAESPLPLFLDLGRLGGERGEASESESENEGKGVQLLCGLLARLGIDEQAAGPRKPTHRTFLSCTFAP